jgi:ribose transport system substrate-binding protein
MEDCMKKLVFFGVFCGLLSFIGCMKQAESATDSGVKPPSGGMPKDIVFGFAKSSVLDPWTTNQVKSILDEAEKRGYRIIMTDAQASTEKQLADIEDLIAKKVDFLIVSPHTEEGFESVYAEARAKGIPIIQADRETTGKWGYDFITTVVSNHYKSGYDNGIWLGENTRGREIKVVEIQGRPGGSDVERRNKGFVDAIAGFPNIKIVASQTGEWSRNVTQRVMQNIIQSLGPDGFNCVYTHNDEMALGAIAACKAAGIPVGVEAVETNKGAMMITVDGQTEAVKSMIDGDINYIVACSSDYSYIFDIIESWYQGEELPEICYTPDYYFTQETVRTEGLQHAYDYTGE